MWLWFRAEGRRRWRSWTALTLLVGVGAGVVIGAAAGARRTESSYTRFLGYTNPSDVVVQAVPFPLDIEAIGRLPEVVHTVNFPYAFLNPAPGEQELELSPLFLHDTEKAEYDRSKVLAGRRADPDRADEATVSPVAARADRIEVGSTLRLQAWTPEGARALLQGERQPPDGVVVSVKIVGVELGAGALLPSEQDEGSLHLTPAFARQYASQIGTVDLLHVKLRRGLADVATFKTGVERIAGDRPVQFNNLVDDTAQVQRAIDLQAVALRLFALLSGAAVVLIVGQALARQAFTEGVDHPTLGALGLSRRERWLATMLRPLTIGLAGAALAGVVAAAGSGLMPFGIARDAEPDPGFSFDALTVLTGVVACAVVVLAVAAYPAWRASRVQIRTRSLAVERPSRLAEALARGGLRPSAVTGFRMAVEPGRGTSAVPTRAALGGTALSVVALVTAFTFGSSLQHLVDTPRLYGWNWEALVGDYFFEDAGDRAIPVLSAAEPVAAFSAIALAEADVGGVRVPAFGFDPVKGAVFPPIVNGREPQQPDEIVLGEKTLRATDRGVGETVTVRVGDRSSEMRIVGRAVLPALSGGDIAGLGEGALLTGQGLAHFLPEAPRTLFAVRFRAGTTAEQREAALAPLAESLGIQTAAPPKRVADFGRVDDMPVILAGVLAALAAATLIHALVSAVRRRRRDLAILKTLGFVRGQLGGTVAWQATTLTLFALGAGLPLGAAAGRWSWNVFAGELGIVPEPTIPVLAVLLIIPLALIVANGVAALPARAAARTRPALVLRSE